MINNRKYFILGCGAVAQCTLPILIKELKIDLKQITIMDFVDNRFRVLDLINNGLVYIQKQITKDNYKDILAQFLSSGDVFIDLSWNIDTCALLQWCHDNNVLYVNTSVQEWDPYKDKFLKNPKELTLYARQIKIKELISSWKSKGSTAIIDHGANPGLVSHFTKQALEDIANKLINENTDLEKKQEITKFLKNKEFAKLAQAIGLKTIHISERDSQITDKPKEVNEFVNTWSVQGFYEEAIAPAELGWGTHEKTLPKGIVFHDKGPKNQIYLQSSGINTFVRSWVPSGEIIGMVIRHGEAFGISDRLTVWQDNKAVYRPTVHYAYCVCDSALASAYELRMRQFEMQPKRRILNNEIIDGKDELGCLLMGHYYGSWWIGSLLDIHESRKLVPNQNATTVQVAVSVVAAVSYMINHPEEGLCLPDDLDHQEILAFAKPYLGEFISKQIDWSPLNRKATFISYIKEDLDVENEWQFTTFLIK